MPATVLVVGDDPAIQRQLAPTLNQEGYELLAARDAAEGVRRWATDGADLVLIDARPGKLDGAQVAGLFRAQATAGRLPLVVLSTEAGLDARVRALKAGADDYQQIPFHPAELMARIKSLLARSAGKGLVGRPPMGLVHAYYGAKGGVGTTTLAINTGIALAELGRKVVVVDGNLQFGDHRVFLDLGLDRKSIVDAVSASTIDAELLRTVVVAHESGIDLLLAPPTPEQSELVREDEQHMARVVDVLRGMYDYVIVDIEQRLDETNLDIIAAADALFVVMTADLSCLKNVRLVLQTMDQLGVEQRKVRLVLNRSNAFTGIDVDEAQRALKRRIDHQVSNQYATAISALNSGRPFMYGKADSPLGKAVLEFARTIDKATQTPAAERQLAPARG